MCGYGNGCCVWINNVPRDLCGPNDDGGQATSINDSGQVAGEMHKKRKGRSYLPNYAFLWANGKLTNIDTQHSAGGSGATCINGSGEIAGYFIDSYNTRHAFYYTSKKGMCPLPSLADLDSVANSVNCSGTIVGYSATKDSPYHACLWFKGQAFDLNTLTSALDEWILLGGASINDRGQIACLAEKNGRRRAIVLIPLD
jgi:probable HAF family extracellular repeat protein